MNIVIIILYTLIYFLAMVFGLYYLLKMFDVKSITVVKVIIFLVISSLVYTIFNSVFLNILPAIQIFSIVVTFIFSFYYLVKFWKATNLQALEVLLFYSIFISVLSFVLNNLLIALE